MDFFVDRQAELDTLQSEYEKDGASLVILYGRRRVGKTTLISKFIEEKNALFFLASEESESINQNEFKNKAADFISNSLLRESSVTNWDAIFKAILETPFKTKPIIVIDEFPYLCKSNPAFSSVFQRIWEEQLKTKSVMVILCGSLISMMISETLAYDSPLYGRRTAQIRLTQIPFRYYGAFFPGKNHRELIELYSVTGGVPKYIQSFFDSGSIYTAIEKNILNRSGYLYDEPHFLLRQEVSEVGSYFSIMKAIAAGNRKLSAISALLEVKATSLTKYLRTLIELDILEREVPVTEENPEKSKKGLYRIKDNYLRFWFSFIYPNLSFLESGNAPIVLDKIKKSFIRNQVAFVYEEICQEKMWELNACNTWPFLFSKVGRYWDSQIEIDIAALDSEGNNLILGECKYWTSPVEESVFWDLEQKSQKVNWKKDCRKTWYIIFGVNGFSPELQQLAKNRHDLILAE